MPATFSSTERECLRLNSSMAIAFNRCLAIFDFELRLVTFLGNRFQLEAARSP